MSDANKPAKPVCPKCGKTVTTTLGSDNAWCHCRWVGKREDCQPQAKRVRTSDATNDIENAFTVWKEAAKRDSYCEVEAEEAKTRVAAWLAQVAADQRQLHAALLACQAMAAVNDYSDFDKVHAARKLALDAMAEG